MLRTIHTKDTHTHRPNFLVGASLNEAAASEAAAAAELRYVVYCHKMLAVAIAG